MTPTEAQIEAAAWLVCPNEIVRCTELCGSCRFEAKKILTAASEVGDDNGWNYAERLNLTIKNTQAATIERCAQVAEAYQSFGGWKIAAAIRALKEEP